jgi:hypothetical protein
MEVLENIAYGIGVVLVIIYLLGSIRTHTHDGQGVAGSTVNATLLFIVSLVIATDLLTTAAEPNVRS